MDYIYHAHSSHSVEQRLTVITPYSALPAYYIYYIYIYIYIYVLPQCRDGSLTLSNDDLNTTDIAAMIDILCTC